ncbi:hypothetical protein Bca101_044009 [Brassica carinata]
MGGCPRFEIRTLEPQHTCSITDRWAFRNHATASVLGGIMRERYGGGSGTGPRPGEVREIMRTDHRVPITYWKAWKSKESVVGQGSGSSEAAYQCLPSYLEKIASENPGSAVALETVPAPDGGQRFKYLFLAFGASIQGFPYMRKVVIIDGTHLKGKYSGCLLTASAQDGNFQNFPIGFGIVDSENDQSWTWFFNKLQTVVPDSYELVYPQSQHCACLMHLQRNVQTIFKKKHLLYLIARAARAFRVEDFYTHFNEIKVIEIACAEYLIRIGFKHWARSHFVGARYNIMTSNLAESLNNALSTAREYPTVGLIEYIRAMLMGWFPSRRTAATKNYEVRDDEGVFHRVDFDRKRCSCREFKMIAIPCMHAVAEAVNGKHDVESMVAREYTTAYWALAYAGSINPVNVSTVATDQPQMKLLPPSTRRPEGSPRKARFTSAGEIRNTGVFKRTRACSRCGGSDHNRATCKMPI